MESLFYALVPDNKQNRKKNLFRNKRGECLFVFCDSVLWVSGVGERQRVKIYLKLQIKKSKETKRLIRVISNN